MYREEGERDWRDSRITNRDQENIQVYQDGEGRCDHHFPGVWSTHAEIRDTIRKMVSIPNPRQLDNLARKWLKDFTTKNEAWERMVQKMSYRLMPLFLTRRVEKWDLSLPESWRQWQTVIWRSVATRSYAPETMERKRQRTMGRVRNQVYHILVMLSISHAGSEQPI